MQQKIVRTLTIMHVEYPYSDDDRQPHQYHSEKQIFPEQWQRE